MPLHRSLAKKFVSASGLEQVVSLGNWKVQALLNDASLPKACASEALPWESTDLVEAPFPCSTLLLEAALAFSCKKSSVADDPGVLPFTSNLHAPMEPCRRTKKKSRSDGTYAHGLSRHFLSPAERNLKSFHDNRNSFEICKEHLLFPAELAQPGGSHSPMWVVT
jgi:hypothetical protein